MLVDFVSQLEIESPRSPAGRDGDFGGWDDEPSAVLERSETASPDGVDQDRITSEFPESIEEAVLIASETRLGTPALPETVSQTPTTRRRHA